jgi:ABC-type phosphate transport system substrate-binding protein
MKTTLVAVLWIAVLQTTAVCVAAVLECGPANGNIALAGSDSVAPMARAWAKVYSAACNINITVREGGSGDGAARVCATSNKPPVDIGTMDRYV